MISIDPGVEYYAYAAWTPTGELVYAGIDDIACHHGWKERQVMERPRIRRHGKKRAPDETVIALTLAAGRLSDRCETAWVDAGVWTHGQTKKQRQPKILAKLAPPERALVLAHSKKNQDHILDAVGIGMHYLETKGIRSFTCLP